MISIELLSGLIIGIIGSYIATILYNKNSERKRKKIEQKITELDYEEMFLEKISKGNTELIRSSFKVLHIVTSIAFMSIGLIILSIAMKPPQIIQYNIMMIGSAAIAAAGFIALSHAKSLMKIADLKKAKEEIEQKRQKLKSKL